LAQVFRRYAADHLDMRLNGPDLLDDNGAVCGHLDVIALSGNRLRIEGWCEGERVVMMVGAARRETRPNLVRPDVAAARGGDPERRVGFAIDAPHGGGRVLLVVERGNLRIVMQLDGFTEAAIRQQQRRLVLPFLRDALRAMPAGLRFVVTGDASAKARVKAALRLADPVPGGTVAMTGRLFDPAPPLPPALPDTAVTIVLPVYNAFDILPEVLDRVERHTDLPWRLVVIEDASTDPAVRPFLRDWAARQEAAAPGRVTLIENEANLGFIRSVNAGLAAARAAGTHAILLNADAFVPAGWASRLIRPLLVHDDVASVTPMSNDAEIFSVPAICTRTVLAPGEADALDALAAQFHPDADLAEAPTGVGFCMAMHARYLAALPDFDTGFGRGYGEEVDWCQRARARGGRHLALPGLFVEHRGGTSFGAAEKLRLVHANNAVIAARYPRYDAEVQEFIRHDPLATPRLALAIAWAARRQAEAGVGPTGVWLAHSLGGGAEDYVQRQIAEALGRPDGQKAPSPGPHHAGAVVLRVGGGHRWRVELHTAQGMAHGVTDDFDFVLRLLEPVAARRVVYSCGVGDTDAVTLPRHLRALVRGPQDRLDILIHDFLPLSPAYTLLNADGSFTGVPPADSTDPAHQTRRPNGERVPLSDWRGAWGALMRAADQITVFSGSSRDLVAAAYPDTEGRIAVRPHRLLAAIPRVAPGLGRDGRPVIGVLGNIAPQKGAGVLVSLAAELARSRAADLVLIGQIDPRYPLPPPAVVHGRYRRSDIPDLIARYGITRWLIPSVWPETFSYATHEAIATGLPVWCFDLGAQAEAVAAACAAGAAGGILPLAMGTGDPAALAAALLHDLTTEPA
jgi:GT2 family glycosyltransferase/glycosyltransferase involved in cell wall biosynthesis